MCYGRFAVANRFFCSFFVWTDRVPFDKILFIRENIDEIYQNFSVFIIPDAVRVVWCVK